jgi:hypothetical protein
LNIYRRRCRTEDQRSMHRTSKSFCLIKYVTRSCHLNDVKTYLLGNLLLLVSWECRKCIKFRANEKWYSSLIRAISNDIEQYPTKYEHTLLNPRAWRYHSFTEFSVDFRERSNMNRIATASLQTSGSMLTNSRWPPKSHIENVMVVRRTEIVFSMKLTPAAQLIKMAKRDTRDNGSPPSVWI